MSHDFPTLLLVMAAAAFLCRAAGFTLMRLVPVSARIEAALRATPLAVMSGIAALAVQSGGLAEGVALAAVVGLTVLIGSDVAAALLGVVLVALLRWAGL
ncbi:AzlD domain-containing protein [Tabrizicola sp. YIM 78059]|uniref:AzlD domain-containing protein n=1 Tax=Tabrizicola sp. YIM 78059 TaxID=2529861 RepID=UPI0010AB034C|nr:AzlD domain-containing protein [Tabrizicola sp. YIM 78059]